MDGKPEPSPVKEIPPAVPQPTGGVAAAPIPNVATATPPVFPAPPHMFPAPSTTQQPSINFLQESQIDMESPHMDPAVVMVHRTAPPPTTSGGVMHQMFIPPTTLAAAFQHQQQHFG